MASDARVARSPTMGNDDRLSDLPDYLLRRILHFAPAKEAASTTALSRRWRTPLWRSSGAVNLEKRIQDHVRDRYGCERKEDKALFFSRRDAFVSAAVAALDAAQHVTRLTLRLESEGECDKPVEEFLYHEDRRWSDWDHSVIGILLSHRAARRVEALRLVANDWSGDTDHNGEIFRWNRVGVYSLTLDSLPSKNLRVLDLTNCSGLYLPTHAAAVVLPRLSSLRLRHCTQDLTSLQQVIDAAPALAVVRLESVLIKVTYDAPSQSDDAWDCGYDGLRAPKKAPKQAVPCRLRCPAATVLVLEGCKWEEDENQRHHRNGYYDDDKATPLVGVEIDSPKLRCFLYKGLLRPFTFSPQPPGLEQVDLHFFPHKKRNKDPCRDLETFWRFVGSFTSTKKMKLTLSHLEDVAVLDEARRCELLPAFRHLKYLELEGVHRGKGKTAAAAIANLLRCSNTLRDLRINLTTEHQDAAKQTRYTSEFLEWKFRRDRDESLDRFDRCCGDSFPSEGDEQIIGVAYDDVPEIPGLSRRSFECLQSSLRRVALQFWPEKSNCLGIKLIKFFAENAMVLEEMHIDAVESCASM